MPGPQAIGAPCCAALSAENKVATVIEPSVPFPWLGTDVGHMPNNLLAFGGYVVGCKLRCVAPNLWWYCVFTYVGDIVLVALEPTLDGTLELSCQVGFKAKHAKHKFISGPPDMCSTPWTPGTSSVCRVPYLCAWAT